MFWVQFGVGQQIGVICSWNSARQHSVAHRFQGRVGGRDGLLLRGIWRQVKRHGRAVYVNIDVNWQQPITASRQGELDVFADRPTAVDLHKLLRGAVKTNLTDRCFFVVFGRSWTAILVGAWGVADRNHKSVVTIVWKEPIGLRNFADTLLAQAATFKEVASYVCCTRELINTLCNGSQNST